MLRQDIEIGGVYYVRIHCQRATVRLDNIRKVKPLAGASKMHPLMAVYDVTDLATGKRAIIRLEAQFVERIPIGVQHAASTDQGR